MLIAMNHHPCGEHLTKGRPDRRPWQIGGLLTEPLTHTAAKLVEVSPIRARAALAAGPARRWIASRM